MATDPAARLVTLPAGVPALTLGWGVIRHAAEFLRQPNGPRAGQRWTPIPSQARFFLWWYALEPDGRWLFHHGVRRHAKGAGKAEVLSARVPTPSGWSTVGELCPGDEVFGGDGQVERVVATHPVLLGEDTFRVTLSDGSWSDFSGGHLFAVDVFVGGRKRVRKTLSVLDMAEMGLTFPRPLTTGRTKCRTGGVSRFVLPPAPVLDLPDRDLPMDPYLLGLWLGDGDSDCPRLTVGSVDLPWLLDRLDGMGVEHGAPQRTNTAHRVRFGRGWAMGRLREMGVLGAKHVPDVYLRAGTGQRLALLQGLMDTDGHVGANGKSEFCSTRKPLADAVAVLLRSLGMRANVRESAATLDGREVGRRWRISFASYVDMPVFTLPRKAARVRARTWTSEPRAVRSVEQVPSAPMRCLTVSSPDGLYLTGETLWVTHNSPSAAVWALEEFTGPVRLDFFDPKAPGGCVGKPVPMPLVQIAATAESQTANTMRMVRAMATRESRLAQHYHLDVGKTVFYAPAGGQLEVITSSAAAAEGAEVTAAVMDETENWTPAMGGRDLAAVLDRNLAKSSSRAVETANAWSPGEDSVAEDTFKAWRAQEEGRTRGTSRILYDARMAPPETDLADEASLDRALEFVYDDCFWVDRRTVKERIWDPRTRPDDARRFYLNQPTAAVDAWTTPQAWAAMARPDLVVGDGEEIVMFFDGSRSRDATALIGCRVEDGHVFKIGVWEPDPAHDQVDVIDVEEVDAAVETAFDRWRVSGFFADVKEWEGFTKVIWPGRYQDDLLVEAVPGGKDPQPIAWDMRSRVYEFGVAAELTAAEIADGAFTQDGDSVLARHVGNARRHPVRGTVTVRKESPDSRKKIDACVAMIGARMVRRLVLAQPRPKPRSGRAVFA